MHRRPRPTSLAGLAVAASLLLGACGASGGSEGSDAEGAAPTSEAPATTEALAADPAGAEEVEALMAEHLADVRTILEQVSVTDTPEDSLATVTEVRDSVDEAEGDLGEIEVADEALADEVEAYSEAVAGTIDVFDEATAAGPATLDAAVGATLSRAIIDAMGAAVSLQDAAGTLLADGAVSDRPSPSEVLAVPEDFPIVSGVRQPAYSPKPEATLQTSDAGPCGVPSAAVVVEPVRYASGLLEEPANAIYQRVLVFEDEDAAAGYIEAAEAFLVCDDPEGLASSEVEPLAEGDGIRIVAVDDQAITSTTVLAQDGDRVMFVSVNGDLIFEEGDAASITGYHADEILGVMREKAAG